MELDEKNLDKILEASELSSLLDEKIQKEIEIKKELVANEDAKAKEAKGFFKKLGNKLLSDPHGYRGKLKALNEFSQLHHDLVSTHKTEIDLPNELLEIFGELRDLIPSNEFSNIQSSFRKDLKHVNEDEIERTKANHERLQELLKVLGYEHSELIRSNDNILCTDALKKIKDNKLEELKIEIPFITKIKNQEIELTEEEELIANIEDYLTSRELEDPANRKKITENISDIKEKLQENSNYKKILDLLEKAQYELKDIKEIELTQTKAYVEELAKQYKQEMSKNNNFLSSFDFSEIKNMIQQKKEAEKKELEDQSKMVDYKSLAYELEQVMANDSENYARINELKEQMEKLANQSGLSESQLKEAEKYGKEEYQDEVLEEKMVMEHIEAENTKRSEVEHMIHEFAMQELRSEGAFNKETTWDYRNGDIYSAPENYKQIISDKIDEILKVADMTPEERVLFYHPDAKNTPDFYQLKWAYRDDAYPFMEDYKKLKQQEAVEISMSPRDYIRMQREKKRQLNNLENIVTSETIEVEEETKGRSL